ncbi:MAG: cytochrome C oxidase subunit II [Thermobacillus sp. ZCTH02-B1]|nr:MAG: cytochrome C oxidase subunit II [Thermobacillus sp. ZCTH02-B1]
MSRDRVEREKHHSLKGALTSVLLLAGIISLSWLGVYLIYINR